MLEAAPRLQGHCTRREGGDPAATLYDCDRSGEPDPGCNHRDCMPPAVIDEWLALSDDAGQRTYYHVHTHVSRWDTVGSRVARAVPWHAADGEAVVMERVDGDADMVEVQVAVHSPGSHQLCVLEPIRGRGARWELGDHLGVRASREGRCVSAEYHLTEEGLSERALEPCVCPVGAAAVDPAETCVADPTPTGEVVQARLADDARRAVALYACPTANSPVPRHLLRVPGPDGIRWYDAGVADRLIGTFAVGDRDALLLRSSIDGSPLPRAMEPRTGGLCYLGESRIHGNVVHWNPSTATARLELGAGLEAGASCAEVRFDFVDGRLETERTDCPAP